MACKYKYNNQWYSKEEFLDILKRGEYNKLLKEGKLKNLPNSGSVVIDENYEPLIVYHGSPYYGFNIFNKSLAGFATRGYSKGIYFTENYDMALNQYALNDSQVDGSETPGVYATFLKLETPAIYNNIFDFTKSIEEGEITNLIIDINRIISDNTIGDRFFTNGTSEKSLMAFPKLNIDTFEIEYSYIDNINKITEKTKYGNILKPTPISKEEFESNLKGQELVIYNEGINNIQTYLKNNKERILKIKKLQQSSNRTASISSNNDGVIMKSRHIDNYTEYVVFEPNQIKSVFNQGTFSKENDNIYQQRDLNNLTEEQYNLLKEYKKNCK